MNETVDHPDFLADFDFTFDLTPSNARILNSLSAQDCLYPGAHIAVPFAPLTDGIAWHHGIYIGNREVIEMRQQSSDMPDIQRVSLFQFLQNDLSAESNLRYSFALIDYGVDSLAYQEKTVQIAQYLLENQGGGELYDLLKLNCEAFATYCRTGKARYSILLYNLLSYHKSINLPLLKKHIGLNKSRKY